MQTSSWKKLIEWTQVYSKNKKKTNKEIRKWNPTILRSLDFKKIRYPRTSEEAPFDSFSAGVI